MQLGNFFVILEEQVQAIVDADKAGELVTCNNVEELIATEFEDAGTQVVAALDPDRQTFVFVFRPPYTVDRLSKFAQVLDQVRLRVLSCCATSTAASFGIEGADLIRKDPEESDEE